MLQFLSLASFSSGNVSQICLTFLRERSQSEHAYMTLSLQVSQSEDDLPARQQDLFPGGPVPAQAAPKSVLSNIAWVGSIFSF